MNNEQEMIVKKLWKKYPFLYNTSLGMYWIGNGVFIADDTHKELFDEYEDFIERIKNDIGKDDLKKINYREIIERHKKVLFNAFDKLIDYGKIIETNENIGDDLKNFIEGLDDNDIINITRQIKNFVRVSDWYIKYEIDTKIES